MGNIQKTNFSHETERLYSAAHRKLGYRLVMDDIDIQEWREWKYNDLAVEISIKDSRGDSIISDHEGAHCNGIWRQSDLCSKRMVPPCPFLIVIPYLHDFVDADTYYVIPHNKVACMFFDHKKIPYHPGIYLSEQEYSRLLHWFRGLEPHKEEMQKLNNQKVRFQLPPLDIRRTKNG